MQSMTTTPTLQAVQNQFTQWRNQKEHRREAIPDELWNSVISLSSQYGRSQLCKTLGLNSSVLKSKLDNCHPISNPDSNHFVEIRLDSVEESLVACTRLEVERLDGSRMRFHFQEGKTVPISSLIQTFLS